MVPDYSARKRGMPIMPLEERLMSKVVINPFSECWEWQGAKYKGYGRITVGSRINGSRHTEGVHRIAYLTWVGDIPTGYEVCHTCDNPCCINPKHLFVGTKADNAHDRDNKNRNVIKVGEEQPRAKLTKKAVKDARWERAYKKTSYQALADKYGVNKTTIRYAIKGKTWKCVSYMPDLPYK